MSNGFDPLTNHRNRSAFINNLHRHFPTPSPIVHHVSLETAHPQTVYGYKRNLRDAVKVFVYDFKSQVNDLINDHGLFGDMHNVVVNPEDPWGRFCPPHAELDEVNSGSWYQETYDRVISDPDNEFLFPIIFYVDKTGTDVMQHYGLEPLTFTTSVLNRTLRNHPRAWRPLGFLPDLDLKSSALKETIRSTLAGKGRTARNYHKCLRIILQSFIELQTTGHIAWL